MTFRKLGLKAKLSYAIKSVVYRKYYKKRRTNFESYHKVYTYPFCKPLTERYDAVIYGSDQIWRKQPGLESYNPIYFAKNDIRTGKHIAFSASMGILPKSNEDINTIKGYLRNLDSIAVRESSLYDIVKRLGYSVHLTIDPTLMLSKEQWDHILKPSSSAGEKYLLLYELQENVFDINMVRKYAKEHNLVVKILKGRPLHDDTSEEITTAGPKVFVSLIKNAEIVLTSSFHGLAFSLIYGKDFFASYKTNSERAKSLLALAGENDRLLPPQSDIPQDVTPIDYSRVWANINQLRSSSEIYLKDALYMSNH